MSKASADDLRERLKGPGHSDCECGECFVQLQAAAIALEWAAEQAQEWKCELRDCGWRHAPHNHACEDMKDWLREQARMLREGR